jgi:nitrogen fixation/metabolism regulation signal transduction histidine kinase
MKKNSTFFLLRWWNGLSVQNRLFTAFTVLVVYCLLALSIYLYMAATLIRINQDASDMFEQNRTIYQLSALSQQYVLAFNQYKVNASDQALNEINAIDGQIDEVVVSLAPDLFFDEDNRDLEEFTQIKAEISDEVTQILAAVDREDWDTVVVLDETVYPKVDLMFTDINRIVDRGWERVEGVMAEKEYFQAMLRVILGLGLPLFLALAGLVALVIYTQINHPLERITLSAEAVLADQFDPAPVENLAERDDEVGLMAQQFLKMSEVVSRRADQLEQEAAEIKNKIR